ncbi:hypothetical protein F9K33_10780 [bacterium]|nr:MAG: hypothetical protein F9K33_10780 [bacterium]
MSQPKFSLELSFLKRKRTQDYEIIIYNVCIFENHFLSFARAKERNKEKHDGYGKTPEPEFARLVAENSSNIQICRPHKVFFTFSADN